MITNFGGETFTERTLGSLFYLCYIISNNIASMHATCIFAIPNSMYLKAFASPYIFYLHNNTNPKQVCMQFNSLQALQTNYTLSIMVDTTTLVVV